MWGEEAEVNVHLADVWHNTAHSPRDLRDTTSKPHMTFVGTCLSPIRRSPKTNQYDASQGHFVSHQTNHCLVALLCNTLTPQIPNCFATGISYQQSHKLLSKLWGYDLWIGSDRF